MKVGESGRAIGGYRQKTVMPFEVHDLAEPEASTKEYLWTLNFGPQHPATHTTLRLILTLDGETVVKAVPDIGFLHSGFEKLGEHLNFNQYVTIVDRMNYISPLANEIAWHHAVEKLLGIELTPRCKYLRTILAELMRLHDHLLNVGTTGLDLGAFTAFLYAFQQRELIYDIVESASGQRFHTSYTRVGGLLYDVNDEWVGKVRSFVKGFAKTHRRRAQAADAEPHFHGADEGDRRAVPRGGDQPELHRSRGAGQRRGSGCPQRRSVPGVRRFGFSSDLRQAGDCYARYLVRMEEMRESIKIIEQAVENMPAGPLNVDFDGKAVLPAQDAKCTAASRD